MLRIPSLWLCWFLLFCGTGVWSHGQPAGASGSVRGVVRVARIVGDVYVTDTATSLRTKLAPNAMVVDGQLVETAARSSVVLVFSNGAVVNVRAESQLDIQEFRQNPFTAPLRVGQAVQEPSASNTRLHLRKGEVISQVKKLNREAGSSFTVETPVGAAGIRGTAFSLLYERRGAVARFALTMAEGLIRFTPVRGRSLDVGAGRALAFEADVDASTGRVLSLPDTLAATEVSPHEAAQLQAALTEAISAAVSIEFVPSTTGGQFSVGAVSTGTSGEAVLGTETAVPSGDQSPDPTTSAIASPPATPPAPRTTPPDGM